MAGRRQNVFGVALAVVLSSCVFVAAAPCVAQITNLPDTRTSDEEVKPDAAPEPQNEGTFLSSALDIGLIYLRPRISLGYGNPNEDWIGLDLNPVVSLSDIGAYGGLRAQWDFINLRVGTRIAYSIQRAALQPQEHYTRDEIEERRVGEMPVTRAKYLANEVELTLTPYFGRLGILLELAVTHITLAPADRYVYEERMRVVAKPPWLLRTMLGLNIRFDWNTLPVQLTPAVEVISAYDRGTLTVRTGLMISMVITDELSVRAFFMATAVTPDSIGFEGANFGQVGIRWTPMLWL